MLAAQGFVSLQFVQLCLCCNVQDEPFLARILISLTFVWSQSVLNSKIRICSDRNEEFMFFFFPPVCLSQIQESNRHALFFLQCRHLIKEKKIHFK